MLDYLGQVGSIGGIDHGKYAALPCPVMIIIEKPSHYTYLEDRSVGQSFPIRKAR